MTRDTDSAEVALADRLVNYSDALVAVSFLGMSGLGVVVADPDIRCSISSAIVEIIVANSVSTLLIVGVIIVLRRWEIDLRSGSPQEGKVARYAGLLHIARLVIVWASLVLSITLAMASGRSECESGPGSVAESSGPPSVTPLSACHNSGSHGSVRYGSGESPSIWPGHGLGASPNIRPGHGLGASPNIRPGRAPVG
jgi:hypothetical protein